MISQFKILYLAAIGFALMIHPIHVSITNMEYFPEKQEIELSTKIFKDDFQLLFAHLKELNIDFENVDSIKKYQKEIDNYISSHVEIEINQKKQNLVFSGFKLNDEAIWLSYNLKIKNEIRSIKIINTLLLDLYFDQKNLLIFKFEDQEYANQFNYKNSEFIIDVDQ
jgi:hypothetical protein